MINRSLVVGAVCAWLASSYAFAESGVGYVTSQDAGVSVVDLATLGVTGTIDVKGVGPRGLGITEDGKFLIVAVRENGSVSVIDTATKQVVKQIPVGKNPVFVRVNGQYAYVSFEPSSSGGPPPNPGAAPAKEEEDDVDD